MTRPLMEDAFGHHTWATIRLLTFCESLTPRQRDERAPGTFGSILQTARHLVGADDGYLFALTGGQAMTENKISFLDDRAGFRDMAGAMERHGHAWLDLLGSEINPDRIVIRYRADESETHAPIGVRLAQALHHGTDH